MHDVIKMRALATVYKQLLFNAADVAHKTSFYLH